jgi:hypothetical protein
MSILTFNFQNKIEIIYRGSFITLPFFVVRKTWANYAIVNPTAEKYHMTWRPLALARLQ